MPFSSNNIQSFTSGGATPVFTVLLILSIAGAAAAVLPGPLALIPPAFAIYLLNSITYSESLSLLPHGLQQTRTSLLRLESHRFTPFSAILNVLVNEYGTSKMGR